MVETEIDSAEDKARTENGVVDLSAVPANGQTTSTNSSDTATEPATFQLLTERLALGLVVFLVWL